MAFKIQTPPAGRNCDGHPNEPVEVAVLQHGTHAHGEYIQCSRADVPQVREGRDDPERRLQRITLTTSALILRAFAAATWTSARGDACRVDRRAAAAWGEEAGFLLRSLQMTCTDVTSLCFSLTLFPTLPTRLPAPSTQAKRTYGMVCLQRPGHWGVECGMNEAGVARRATTQSPPTFAGYSPNKNIDSSALPTPPPARPPGGVAGI